MDLCMSEDQKAMFLELKSQAEVNARNNSTAVGVYAPVYNYLIECFAPAVDAILDLARLSPLGLSGNIVASEALAIAIGALDEGVKNSVIWLIGASGVNAGEGLFASVIREYNVFQMAMRYGVEPNSSNESLAVQIQNASNAVGHLVAEQIVVGNYALPSVGAIGEIDLNGVRDTLYTQNGDNLEGGELYLNQAWPGIVMLNKLRETQFVDRLLQVGKGDPATTVEAASAGTDTVESSLAWTLGANLENLVLTGTLSINGTGNTVANVITGNVAANRLDGGTGADTLVGGAGDDVYVLDNSLDSVVELASEGLDRVEAAISYVLGANVENLTLMGTGNNNGTGNDLANTLIGTTGNNRLDGGIGADTLTGGKKGDGFISRL